MFNQNHAYQQQQQLMQQQFANQQALNLQGQKLAQENWDYTNAENQVNHYKKAGLNVGLMYGGSGGGGQLSSGSGGSAASGSAPNMPDMAGLAMQMASQQSQIKLNEALANKANADAIKTSGADTDNVKANTALTNMNKANATIQNNIATMTQDDIIATIGANRNKALGEAKSAMTQGNIYETTYKNQIEKINNETILSGIKITAEKQGIELSKAQIINMQKQIEIGQVNAEKIGVDQVMGKSLNQLIEKIYDKLGVKNEVIKQ
jgi:hypothetical protein